LNATYIVFIIHDKYKIYSFSTKRYFINYFKFFIFVILGRPASLVDIADAVQNDQQPDTHHQPYINHPNVPFEKCTCHFELTLETPGVGMSLESVLYLTSI
jgi:hypothetical protein